MATLLRVPPAWPRGAKDWTWRTQDSMVALSQTMPSVPYVRSELCPDLMSSFFLIFDLFFKIFVFRAAPKNLNLMCLDVWGDVRTYGRLPVGNYNEIVPPEADNFAMDD